jgi:hypothetical protein
VRADADRNGAVPSRELTTFVGGGEREAP